MKTNKGITLISLVITIVILIILASVTINMTVGENGLFTKAREAKRLQKIAEANEKMGIEILAAQMEALERDEELEQEQLEDIISNYGELQEDGDTIILKDNGYETSLLAIYKGTTTTTGSYTENKAKLELLENQVKLLEEQKVENQERIALLESQVELLEQQKADLQNQLEELAASEGDQAQRIVELTEQIQTLEQEKNTVEQNLIAANAKVEEYEALKETLEKTNATADKILKDYKAYSNGQLITGTMTSYAGTTQTATVSKDSSYTYLTIPKNGYYTTGSRLRTANSNINDKTYFIKNGVIQSGYSMVNPTTGITWKYVASAGLLSCESTVTSTSNYTKVLGAISIDVTNFNKIVLAASSYHLNHQPCITLGTTTSHVGSNATITRVLDVSGYTGKYYVKIETIHGTCGTYSYDNYAPLEVTTGESSTTGKAWFVVYDLYAM